MTTRTAQIDATLEADDWAKARELLLQELKRAPDDHWLLTRLSTTYYEERKYSQALKLSERAVQLAPQCPLALWDYAGALDMLGREPEAIGIWRRIIERGAAALAKDECGEGIRWARSLVNDARYRIALALRDVGKSAAALQQLDEHLAHRSPGCSSIYPLAEVRVIREALSNDIRPRQRVRA